MYKTLHFLLKNSQNLNVWTIMIIKWYRVGQ